MVIGNVVGGLTAVALFRRLRAFADHEMPFYGVLLGFVIYLTARILNHGLLTLFHIGGISTLILFGLFVPAMVLKHPDLARPVSNKKAGAAVQCYAAKIDIGGKEYIQRRGCHTTKLLQKSHS